MTAYVLKARSCRPAPCRHACQGQPGVLSAQVIDTSTLSTHAEAAALPILGTAGTFADSVTPSKCMMMAAAL